MTRSGVVFPGVAADEAVDGFGFRGEGHALQRMGSAVTGGQMWAVIIGRDLAFCDGVDEMADVGPRESSFTASSMSGAVVGGEVLPRRAR